ncbi:Superoxide dismutase [Cu-Zn] [Tephrocybe sp. NHM501043]|nr:Superoxide dismutase [Cu-Zn] [Tephrocybe sp. NHM501043]
MDSLSDSKSYSVKSTKRDSCRFFHFPLVLLSVVFGYTILYLASAWWFGTPSAPQPLEKAVAILSGPSNVSGTVTFYQAKGRGPVTVSGSMHNLDHEALRGFHVHQFGDLSQGCLSAGPHFNPFGKTHGAPTDKNRHVGDLGNIESDSDGSAIFTFEDTQLALNGPLSVVGRAVVVHAGTDDLGQGGDEESLKTGNAGARAACGVIGIRA